MRVVFGRRGYSGNSFFLLTATFKLFKDGHAWCFARGVLSVASPADLLDFEAPELVTELVLRPYRSTGSFFRD